MITSFTHALQRCAIAIPLGIMRVAPSITMLCGLFLLPLNGHTQEWRSSPVPTWLRQVDVPEVPAMAFDVAAAAADDALRAREGRLPLYARFVPCAADPFSTGVWHTLANGDRVWRVALRSPGARAVEVVLDGVDVPEGALFVFHDGSGGQLQGGYGPEHAARSGVISSLPVIGDRVVVEYYEPGGAPFRGSFRIEQLLHSYRDLGDERAGACMVDVACSEGDGWSEQRDAVVRIRVVVPVGAGFCSGTLMNNSAQDCRPLVLTAFHCGEDSEVANFGSYQFLFNYQRSCDTGTAPSSQVMTGCLRLADSNDSGPQGGGTYGSDFMLLELNNLVPGSFNAFYAGWQASAIPPSNAVSIHHPAGDPKCISTYSAPATDASWAGFTSGSHWRVNWVPTANGHGVMEPGSSGAPLFNAAKRVVGTLTGGASCCTVNACGSGTGPNEADLFGKVIYHWTENPNPPEEKLYLFLSPTGNFTQQNGSYAPCGGIGVPEVAVLQALEVLVQPTMRSLSLRCKECTQGAQLLVLDATGRFVVHHTTPGLDGTVVPLPHLRAGAYLLRVSSDEGDRTFRFAVTE